MPVLWTPHWQYSEDWSVPRQYVWGFALQWQPMFAVQTGQTLVLQETPFGGFQTHIKFRLDWWTWVSSNWRFVDIFEDFYVTAPGSSTPISALDQTLEFTVSDLGLPVLRAAQPAMPGQTAYLKFPLNPPVGYWADPQFKAAPDFYIVNDP